MKYTMTQPCQECPFLKTMAHGFKISRLLEFASGEFACHQACDVDDETSEFHARGPETPHCAGALIFNEKREKPHQMMRISERLGFYDRCTLKPEALALVRDPLVKR